ncbi:MAG: tripartite tricarboxylate transporter substrate binding protein [Lautropia sp.]
MAQQFPSKPIRIVVPFGVGGGVDITTRALAKSFTEGLGQTIVVDNKTGGNGIIGTQFAAKSDPDGYTLLVTGTIFLVVPSMIPSAPYDPLRDFTPVGVIGWVPQLLVVHPELRVNTIDELIARAKADPGKLSYASGGNGSGAHMAMELFMRQAGISMTHVPYKSDAPAMVDVLGGQVPAKFDNVVTSLPHVTSGKLRALGITSPKRFDRLPDLPTVSESLPGYEASIFYAMFAPAGTPPEVIARLHRELSRFTENPETRDSFARQGVDLQSGTSPQDFAAFIKADHAKWARIVKEAGIKAE